MIQYMAVGIPTIASAVGFNCEVLRDRLDGFLVRSFSWQDKLSALIQNPELRTTLGANARRRAVEMFDIRVAVAKYLHILERV